MLQHDTQKSYLYSSINSVQRSCGRCLPTHHVSHHNQTELRALNAACSQGVLHNYVRTAQDIMHARFALSSAVIAARRRAAACTIHCMQQPRGPCFAGRVRCKTMNACARSCLHQSAVNAARQRAAAHGIACSSIALHDCVHCARLCAYPRRACIWCL